MSFLDRIFHNMSANWQTGKDGLVLLGDRIYSGQLPSSALHIQGNFLGL